jgi:hypothetical protein
MATSHLMTADQARAKVVECMEMAAVARDRSHKIMLEHMAGTWQRIAKDIDERNVK